MIFYACEECGTFSEHEPKGTTQHVGHHVLGIEGTNYDELSRTAAAHIVLARRIRRGDSLEGSSVAMQDARIHADWFCEEDTVYDPI